MGIAFDAASNKDPVGGYPASVTYSHTVGVGTDRVLIVGVVLTASATTPSVTFAGVPMGLVRATSYDTDIGRASFVFSLAGPASGAQNIVIDNSSAFGQQVSSQAVSYSGANQASIVDVAADASTFYPNTSLTTTATTTIDKDWGVLFCTSAGTIGASTNTTQRAASSTAQMMIGDTDGDVTPVGVHSMTATCGAFGGLLTILVFIRPAVAGGAAPLLSLLGVGC